VWRLNKEYGLRYFLRADDNFFNDKSRTLRIVEQLAGANSRACDSAARVRWYTEVTVHDTLQMKEHLRACSSVGLPRLWLGVEESDRDAVKKGQSATRRPRRFARFAVPHLPDADEDASRHAALYSRGSNYGC